MKHQTILSCVFFMVILFTMVSCQKDKQCIEQTQPTCLCTMQYEPVCGCNEKTYGNPCSAECSGITNYTMGECD